jgi:hypothetical protein
MAFFIAYRWYRARPGRPALHLDVAATGLLAFLTGGFFWRPMTESAVWMPAGGGDFASFYFPTYSYVAQQVKGGSLPLWNPHVFAGMPLAADVQTALFYPVNWILFLFVRVEYGSLEWLLIAHYWLAATLTYIFLRDSGLGRLGSMAGGLAFAFCGFMVAHFGHLPMVPVATWMPLVLLCLRRAHVTPGGAGWAWSIAAGLCLAMSLLAGHVQIFAYVLLAAGLLWLVLLLGGPLAWRGGLSWALKGLLAVALALGIGAIQLLPSLELSTQSVRAAISYEEASEFSAQPITLINLVLPRVFGGNPTEYNFGIYQTTENWGYCGVITLALAGLGLALRRSRMLAFFALLAALGLIIMLGDLTIMSGWLYKFAPGFNKLRDSGRALVLLGFGLAGLAAFGLDGLVIALKNGDAARRTLLGWLLAVTGVLALAVLVIMPSLYVQVLSNQTLQYGFLPGAINDLGAAILWIGLLAGAGWAAYTRRLRPELAGALVIGLLVLDLFSPNSMFNPTTEDVTAGFKHADAYQFVRDNTADSRSGIPLRVNSDTNVQKVWQPSSASLEDFYDTGGAWNPLKLERYDYLWNLANRYPDTPLYDLTGAALQVISPTLGAHAGQPKWELAYEEAEIQMYRDKNTLPRAFLVHDAVTETNPESVVVSLRRFDVDPSHTVILETGAPARSTNKGTAEPGANSGESVHATRYSPNDVDIAVVAKSPGWLVLTDAWYPGWRATVDGREVPVEVADYAYRAVRVETGEHQVAMRFRPASWTWGRVLSGMSLLAGLLGLAALLVVPRLRKQGKSVRPAAAD